MNPGGRTPEARYSGEKGQSSARSSITCDLVYRQVNHILTNGGTSTAQRLLTPANRFPPEEELQLPQIVPRKQLPKTEVRGSINVEDGAKFKSSMLPPPTPPLLSQRTGSTISVNNHGLYGAKHIGVGIGYVSDYGSFHGPMSQCYGSGCSIGPAGDSRYTSTAYRAGESIPDDRSRLELNQAMMVDPRASADASSRPDLTCLSQTGSDPFRTIKKEPWGDRPILPDIKHNVLSSENRAGEEATHPAYGVNIQFHISGSPGNSNVTSPRHSARIGGRKRPRAVSSSASSEFFDILSVIRGSPTILNVFQGASSLNTSPQLGQRPGSIGHITARNSSSGSSGSRYILSGKAAISEVMDGLVPQEYTGVDQAGSDALMMAPFMSNMYQMAYEEEFYQHPDNEMDFIGVLNGDDESIAPPPSYDQRLNHSQHQYPQPNEGSIVTEDNQENGGDSDAEETDKPNICLWMNCNQLFSDQEQLVQHIEKQHIDQRRGDAFACLWVGCKRQWKPFNARYKLLIHMRVHSGEKPHKCTFEGCDKSFSRLENLKIHLRSHTGERPYQCQCAGCPKAFSNSSDRAKHQRTHQDTKPYACTVPGCNKRYTDPSSLRKHQKNHGNLEQQRKKVRKDGLELLSFSPPEVLGKCMSVQSIRQNGSPMDVAVPSPMADMCQEMRFGRAAAMFVSDASSSNAAAAAAAADVTSVVSASGAPKLRPGNSNSHRPEHSHIVGGGFNRGTSRPLGSVFQKGLLVANSAQHLSLNSAVHVTKLQQQTSQNLPPPPPYPTEQTTDVVWSQNQTMQNVRSGSQDVVQQPDIQQDLLQTTVQSNRQEAPLASHLPPVASSLYTDLNQSSYYNDQPTYDYHQYPAMAQHQQVLLQRQQQQLQQQQQHHHHHHSHYISDYIGMPCNMQERMTSHQTAAHMFNHLPLTIEQTLANLPYDAVQLHRALSTHSGFSDFSTSSPKEFDFLTVDEATAS